MEGIFTREVKEKEHNAGGNINYLCPRVSNLNDKSITINEMELL